MFVEKIIQIKKDEKDLSTFSPETFTSLSFALHEAIDRLRENKHFFHTAHSLNTHNMIPIVLEKFLMHSFCISMTAVYARLCLYICQPMCSMLWWSVLIGFVEENVKIAKKISNFNSFWARQVPPLGGGGDKPGNGVQYLRF